MRIISSTTNRVESKNRDIVSFKMLSEITRNISAVGKLLLNINQHSAITLFYKEHECIQNFLKKIPLE